jgi:hypothetical protein
VQAANRTLCPSCHLSSPPLRLPFVPARMPRPMRGTCGTFSKAACRRRTWRKRVRWMHPAPESTGVTHRRLRGAAEPPTAPHDGEARIEYGKRCMMDNCWCRGRLNANDVPVQGAKLRLTRPYLLTKPVRTGSSGYGRRESVTGRTTRGRHHLVEYWRVIAVVTITRRCCPSRVRAVMEFATAQAPVATVPRSRPRRLARPRPRPHEARHTCTHKLRRLLFSDHNAFRKGS